MPRGSSTLPNVNSAGDQNINVTNSSLVVSDVTSQSTLSAINTKITTCDTSAVTVSSSALPSGAATAVLQTGGNSSLASISSAMVACDTGNVVVATSALPNGAATSALQTGGNASLSSIDTKLTGPIAVSASVTINGSRGNLINNSAVVSGDFTTSVNIASYTKSSLVVKSNSSDMVEVWISQDSGVSYDYHGSLYPSQPTGGGSDNYAYLKLENDVLTDVKLKFTGTASAVTGSLFSRV